MDLNQIVEVGQAIVNVGTSVVTVASVAAAAIPSNRASKVLNVLRTVVEVLALNIGYAKQRKEGADGASG